MIEDSTAIEVDWLQRYANGFHAWKEGCDASEKPTFYRPLGLIETSFDIDGFYFEGRADINASLCVEISSYLSEKQLRRRILLAWSALRMHHVLLMGKALDKQDSGTGRYFVITPPSSSEEAIAAARDHIVFVADYHSQVDHADFYCHAQNVARVVDPSQALAKLFVLPIEEQAGPRAFLRFLFVMGHEISDGLTNYTWLSHFIRLLNAPLASLNMDLKALINLSVFKRRLPSAQEDLYPPISGSKPRQRWYWAITRILSHVRKPQPAAFPNPLRRISPYKEAVLLPPTYSSLFNYARLPPLNTFTIDALIPRSASQQLHKLCREVGASVGAGCFVLVAMVMMSLHEERFPNEPPSARCPFVGGFPINPRPFFNHAEPPDSLMLAFSDGVILPFLSSSLDLATRIRLLVRQAHRQLQRYQKRQRTDDAEKKAYMGNHGAGRVLAFMYISAMERQWLKLPVEIGRNINFRSPQGEYPVSPNPTPGTNGISSVGRTAWKEGVHNIDTPLAGKGEDAFVADFRGTRQNVRAREGEFLVGIWGNQDDTIAANVSFDGNAIDEDMANKWKHRMETILDGLNPPAKL